MVTYAKPKRRERPTRRTGLDGHGGQPAADFLSVMRYAVQIASQRLLANASGSVRSGSTGHHQRAPGALEVSKPAVWSAHLYRAPAGSCGAIRAPDRTPGGYRSVAWP